MKLTRGHFDQQIAKLATKENVQPELREFVEDLARIVANTIATPFTKRFDRACASFLRYAKRVSSTPSVLLSILQGKTLDLCSPDPGPIPRRLFRRPCFEFLDIIRFPTTGPPHLFKPRPLTFPPYAVVPRRPARFD